MSHRIIDTIRREQGIEVGDLVLAGRNVDRMSPAARSNSAGRCAPHLYRRSDGYPSAVHPSTFPSSRGACTVATSSTRRRTSTGASAWSIKYQQDQLGSWICTNEFYGDIEYNVVEHGA